MTLKVQILEPSSPPTGQVIFFTTTAFEALEVDPLNRPAKLLHNLGIRVISFDLPFHDDENPTLEGVYRWVKSMEENNHDPLPLFFEQLEHWVQTSLDPTLPVGFMGISRGAFIAAHLAHKLHLHVPLVLFSPLMHLEYERLWQKQTPNAVHHYRLENLASFLKDSPVYLAISNNDEKVHTNVAISLYQTMIQEKQGPRIRNTPLELHIFPSIGMHGHGTSDPIFAEGVDWMMQQLKIAKQ